MATTVSSMFIPVHDPEAALGFYRDALGLDDATWLRGIGWALTGVFGIPYYRDTNPVLVADKVTAIEAVLADRR